MRDSKGLRDLHALLASPGTAVAALDLATAAGSQRPGAPAGPDGLHAPSDTGEVIDAQARAAYGQRLSELEEAGRVPRPDDADLAGPGRGRRGPDRGAQAGPPPAPAP